MDSNTHFISQAIAQPVDLNSELPPVQGFAFGGIANPVQRAFLNTADRTYLEARKAEIDKYEAERKAYNDALTKWQNEVYNPYKSQVDEYNTALTKWQNEVYNPYAKQYEAYEKAVNAWNAGPRTSDYSGPAAPNAPTAFSLTAPKTPEQFSMAAPTMPFKEEDVVKYQQEASQRAQEAAKGRAVAIDVVSNPDAFNFGSMAIAKRFMAEGGPVEKDDDEAYDRTADSVVRDFQSFGYTPEEIQELAQQVADAGRGGDELLAYLSPESMEFLKAHGGSGTINPITGLPEFKGGVFGAIGRAVTRIFSGRKSPAPQAAPTPAPAPVAAAPAAPAGPSPAELARQLEAANAARAAAEKKAADDLAALRAQQEAIARAQQAIAVPTMGQAPQPAPAPAAPPPPPPPVVQQQIAAQNRVANNTAAAQLQALPTNLGPVTTQLSMPQLNLSRQAVSGVARAPSAAETIRNNPAPGTPSGDERSPNFTGPVVPQPGIEQPQLVGAQPPMPSFPSNPGVTPMPFVPQPGIGKPDPNKPLTGRPFEPEQMPIYRAPPPPQPLFGQARTEMTLAANRSLAPGMIGGMENAGVMFDRLGNRIFAPGQGMFPGFAKGGDIDVASLMAQNAETLSDEQPEERINTNPVGTAQQFLADLAAATPNAQSIRRGPRTTAMPKGGGSARPKSAGMQLEELSKGDMGAMKDFTPKERNTDSARGQLEEMVRQYQIKTRAAQNKAKGFSADTFGAPTLEGPTLTKNSLSKKRFAKGGEAKKDDAEAAEPSLLGVNSYATRASERMFPGQMGQDDQRDAARHMLAAAMVARKTNPGVAEFLGKVHERTSNPESFFSMFGIGKPRDDYEMDVHNNRIGAELAARTKSQAELEQLVQALARQSKNRQVPGKPWTMSREQMEARKAKGMTPPPEYGHGGAVHRAEGSPEEGEMAEASKPAFVTPKSGKGRKRGPVSDAINSGEALTSMARGVTELPYDIAGAPVDLATMLMRPLGYSNEKPMMGSDWIKEKMTGAGVRPQPPSDPTARGFYTAGELLSNLTNPAGVARAGVKGAKKVGEKAADVAKDFQQYNRQLDVPGASYAVRPTGSTVLSGTTGLQNNVSGIDKLLNEGLSNVRSAAGQNADQAGILTDFWNTKARNYFTRQFGTPDDPIARGIGKKQIRGSVLEEAFPEYMIDQMNVGKTRVNEQGQERFFPKHPRAIEDFTQRYDAATGLSGNVVASGVGMGHPEYQFLLSDAARARGAAAKTAEEDRMLTQGVRPELINSNVGVVARSGKDPERVIGDGTPSAEALLRAYEEADAYRKMTPEQQTAWANEQFGNGRTGLSGLDIKGVGESLLPTNVMTAIDKGEPVYDISSLGAPLSKLFKPSAINQYLASLPPREAANIRFEDAVRGALKMGEDRAQMDNLVARIKAGKPVADSVFSKGVSAPIMQFQEGPLEGFAWKRIEDRKATVPEGAYVGHSVGGYELGGATYTSDKREGFNTGQWQIYTLRDNRNRPVNTIEVKMLDEYTPVVTQIKGNGRATGNVAATKYDTAILSFLQNHLKPAQITEKDEYLTPLLRDYKAQVTSQSEAKRGDDLLRELGLD